MRAILFDLDGVVIDSEPLYELAELRLFQHHQIDVRDEDWPLFKGLSQEAFFDLIDERYRPQWHRSKAVEESEGILRSVFQDNLAYMAGFLPLVERLEGRYLLGLVTSSSREILDFVSSILPDLPAIFEETLCGDEVQRTKPHPEPYLTMMARLGVSPESTAVVEDSPNGLRSALASGAYCIALAGSVPVDTLTGAHRVIHSLDEITEDLLQRRT